MRALLVTGSPALGISLHDLLAHGYSWRELVVTAPSWGFIFLVALFFTRPDRFERDQHGRCT